MKSIQITKPGVMSIVDRAIPRIASDTDVLVHVRAVGICGSDIHIYHGTNPYAVYPRVPGHEVAGEVVEVGRAVKRIKIGDKVVLEPIASFCESCYACKKGRYNVCQNLKVSGVHVDGGFQEYIVAKERMVHKFPDYLTFEQATLIEPYTIGEQSNFRAGTAKDDIVLIHGAGPIGLIICDVAKQRGAFCIISEINGRRLEIAKEFGADCVINPSAEDLKKKIAEITDGAGPNVIFETTGAPSLLNDSVRMVSAAGTVVPLTFGSDPIPIDFKEVNKKEVNIVGTRLQSNKFPVAISYISSKKDKINKLITHIYPVDNYMEAFETFMNKESGACKVVLTF